MLSLNPIQPSLDVYKRQAVFKEDRDAYLIKVCSDDETELTSINTKSEKSVPLQCTEAFFDSKKSVIKGQQCKKLNMVFKRNDETYFTGAVSYTHLVLDFHFLLLHVLTKHGITNRLVPCEKLIVTVSFPRLFCGFKKDYMIQIKIHFRVSALLFWK